MRLIVDLARTASMSFLTSRLKSFYNDKRSQVVLFSSTAIALYGYGTDLLRIRIRSKLTSEQIKE